MLIVPIFVGEIMEEMIQRYLLAFDEINKMTAISYASVRDEDILSRRDQLIDDILTFLIKAYKQGIENVGIMLSYDTEIDVDLMYEVIYEVIDGKTFEDRIFDHLIADDLNGLQTLAQSEYHRVYNLACEDGAGQFAEDDDALSSDVIKTWNAIVDNVTRDTHLYLNGTSVDLQDEFYTFDGDHAPCPGSFEKASNNANCRCWLTYKSVDDDL